MNLANIGAGHIDKTLGGKRAAAGHTVHYGVRVPAEPKFGELEQAVGTEAMQPVAAAIDSVHPATRVAAEQSIAGIGLRVVYVGVPDAAATVDGIMQLWFALAFSQSQVQQVALKLLAE